MRGAPRKALVAGRLDQTLLGVRAAAVLPLVIFGSQHLFLPVSISNVAGPMNEGTVSLQQCPLPERSCSLLLEDLPLFCIQAFFFCTRR